MRNGKLMTKRVAAIALSSMMVLSPLTAFASSGDPVVPGQNNDPTVNAGTQDPEKFASSGDIFGTYLADEEGNYILDQNGNKIPADPNGSIQTGKIEYGDKQETESYFLDFKDSDETKAQTVKDANGNVTTAYFKKTIYLEDIKNKGYIPSVPDVQFNYVIEAADIDAGAKAGSDYVGYNGAMIHKGLTDKDGNTIGISTETTVVFHHDDNPNGDKSANEATYPGREDNDPTTMTKLVKFNLDPVAFQGKDPGIYRYIVVETEELNAVDIEGKTQRDITDDVTKIADGKRGRILDVVVQRADADPTSDKRIVVGVAMREADITNFGKNGQGKYTWTIKAVNGKVKVEGYTPYAFNDQSGSKGEEDGYSRYYTYDLLIDKEVFGQGLTDKEATDAYMLNLTVTGPVGAEIKVVAKSNNAKFAEGFKVEERVEIGADGTLTLPVALTNNQWYEISGLPTGATYTLTEDTKLSKIHVAINSTRTDGAIAMDTADRLVEKVDHDKAIAAMKPVSTEEKIDNKFVVVKDQEIKKLTDELDVQNVLVGNERLPITVTGVVMNVAPYALMVIAAAIFAGLFISKKRQEEEL